jgi:uncharacterized integral membrane protein
LKSVIGFLIILALVIFLLSNRVPVDIGFWPFGQVATLPLGAVVLAVLVLGFLLGLAFHLPHRFALNRRAKRAEKRVAELESRTSPPPAAF